MLFTTPDVISHSLSVHLSPFDGVESCPHVELTLINTSAHLVLWYNGTGSCIPLPISELTIFRIFIGMNLAWWYLVTTTSMISAAYTQAFLDAFASLGIEPWAGIEMDVAWGQTTLRFGLHRPSVTGPIFVYRVCTALRQDTPTRMQVLSHADLSPDQLLSAIAGQHPDLRDTWADGGWQLCAIDATRGHSRDRSLMHPCYILIQVDDYWVFNHRPHGLLELVLGSLDLSFPCVLPQMINFPVLQAFLSPLLPQGLSCLSLQMWHNGAAVDYQLVSCFNGFFIQVVVEVNNILMENIRLAAPLIIPQLHIDQMVLTDPQLLQVTAFVPGGDTLISSRSLTMTEKRNRVFTILDSVLRQRFADMRNVGFLLLTAHPSSKWMDSAFSPQKEKVVVVYSDDVLQGSASVLLRLSLPPHDAEGAIYVRRRLRLVLSASVSPTWSFDAVLMVLFSKPWPCSLLYSVLFSKQLLAFSCDRLKPHANPLGASFPRKHFPRLLLPFARISFSACHPWIMYVLQGLQGQGHLPLFQRVGGLAR